MGVLFASIVTAAAWASGCAFHVHFHVGGSGRVAETTVSFGGSGGDGGAAATSRPVSEPDLVVEIPE